MSEATVKPEPPKRGFLFTHEFRFYVAVFGGLIPAPFLWKISTAVEGANQITVRPPWIFGVVYILLAVYAAFEYARSFARKNLSSSPPSNGSYSPASSSWQ